MGSNRTRSLEWLQAALHTISGSREPQIRHGVVLFTNAPPYDAETIHPCIYSSCQQMLDGIVVPMAGDVSQVHYLFGEHSEAHCQDTLQQFKEVLRAEATTINALPAAIVATHGRPLSPNGLNDSFVRWMLLLYSLASRTDQHIINTEVEFGRTTKDLTTPKFSWPSIDQHPGMRPWDEFAPLPGFNVVDLLTFRAKNGQGIDYWRKKYSAVGTSLPEVFSASLTKPILYASINAIDLLLRLSASPRKAVTKASSIKMGGVTSFSDLETLLLAFLIAQHGTLDDKSQANDDMRSALGRNNVARIKSAEATIAKRRTPLTQINIVEILNQRRGEAKRYNQSEISKGLKRLFGRLKGNEAKVMKSYRALCKGDGIAEALDALQTRPENPAHRFRKLCEVTAAGLTYEGVVNRRTRQEEREYSSKSSNWNMVGRDSDAVGSQARAFRKESAGEPSRCE